MKAVSGAAVAIGAGAAADVGAAAQSVRDRKAIKAVAFDAYGTLFDVYSVTALCDQLYPGNGSALAQLWRAKQLQYSFLRTLMGRYKDFWQLTEDGLVYATKSLKLVLTPDRKKRLMEAYLSLAAFPDVKPGLEALKAQGIRLAILSNGEPKMLEAVATSAGLGPLLDAIVSVDELKIFKPSPKVYRLASNRLKVNPGEMGFVSSNSWDVNGAGSTGLRTFWIQRNAREPEEELGFPAAAIVHAITDLPGAIRG